MYGSSKHTNTGGACKEREQKQTANHFHLSDNNNANSRPLPSISEWVLVAEKLPRASADMQAGRSLSDRGRAH